MNMKTEKSVSERCSRIESLMRVEKTRIQAITTRISKNWSVRPVALPQAGLGLLKLQDGAFHESFYLGEFPLATAHIAILTDPDGEEVEGAASMMTDDAKMVEALAMCDAVLTHQLDGWQEIQNLVAEGKEIEKQTTIRRNAMLEKTRVDFSLLDEAGSEHED